MVRLSVTGALVFALLPAVGAQQPAQFGSGQWPPPDTYRIGNGITAPRLIQQVKAAYTGDAMRAKIQGVVKLECVVEPDGSVGPIRIVRSLDAVHGLDEEAVEAVKQWRFAPGMKDNVPVPVVVTVDLTFTVRDGPTRLLAPAAPPTPGVTLLPAPTRTWPEGFESRNAAEAAPDTWAETTTEASGLVIKLAYPTGWTVRKNVSPTQLLVINNGDGTRSVTVMPPASAPFSIDRATTTSESLQRLMLGLQGGVLDPKKGEVVATGQTQTAGNFWVWLDVRTDTSAISSDAVRSLFDKIRLWTFVTTLGGQMVTATCVVAVPRDADQAERDARLRQATTDFGGIIRRLTVGLR